MLDSILPKLIIQIPVFLLALTIHEAAHAFVALRFGDDTAKRYGRLTLNPIAHIDLFGTLIIPIALGLMGGFMFGWAKPVPIDTRQFKIKNFKKAVFWVSFAGPLSNFILMFISAVLLAVVATKIKPDAYFFTPMFEMLRMSVAINASLAIFNLIPLPPLDGSNMVSTFLSYNTLQKYEQLSRYSFFIILGLGMTGAFSYIIMPVQMMAFGLTQFIAGLLI